ncbi:TonB-dependent siderophore receptor [Altericroceibacterium spongiae]|uniref:TonB-dependent siderophore receptor n=1 Tax=Altericroceibacterium spongiae TaxID=2320269 RepID=A0A420EA87_9SPHN|nr:TonB-dependent siderophore receptor [Altericroceibacterium spongiae]RKF17607.1 TonB-dependent siderophore receptor [Altericroceibacterium spongiae]
MMNLRKRRAGRVTIGRWSASASLVALSCVAASVHAEELASPSDREIVVTGLLEAATGTKSGTPVREVPQSLSIVGREQIEVQAAQTVSQAIAYQAGVFNGSTSANGRYDRISLRGFDIINTGVLQDGLRATTVQTYTKAEPYGLEQIEVLRGPASVLYGQNAPGGLVNMITKRPTDTPLYEVAVQGGSFDRIQGQFDLGGPVSKDVSVRLTGLARDADTQIDLIPDNKIYIAPALSWTRGSSTKITLLTSYSYEEYGPPMSGLPAQGSLLPNPNGKIDRHLYTDEPGVDNHRNQYRAALLLDQDIGASWRFASSTRYSKTQFLSETVSARGAPVEGRILNRSFYRFDIDGQVWASDNHLSGDWSLGPLAMDSLVGVDYRHTKEDYWLRAGAAPPLDVFDPVYGQPYGPATTPFSSTLQSSDQTGLYAEQSIRYADLILSGSIRHDWSDTTTRNRLDDARTEQNDEATTWRVGAVYRGPAGLTPYVSYATSFNPILGADFYGDAYKPSEADQYEAGLRIEPPEWKSYLALSAYRLTQSNVLTRDPENDLNQIQIGEVRSKGFEAELVTRPVTGLNLTASVTLADFTDSETDLDPTGKPERMASFWADYDVPEGPLAGFGIGGGLRYIGSSWADSANTIRVPDYALVDAMVRYDWGSWRLSLNATNLFDKDYYVSCSTSSCGVGTERTIMASLRYRLGGAK